MPDNDGVPRDLRGVTIVSYVVGKETGTRCDLFLQINPFPQGQERVYSAAVYARRFRLFTGWHGFRISPSDAQLKHEADRLSNILARKWFGTPEGRRALRASHPEFSANLPWKQR